MTIQKETNGRKLAVTVAGRLDTTTAPQLEEELNASLDDIDELDLDFKELEYISSAGLRVLLSMQKIMGKRGGLVVRSVNDVIMEIFEVTGFSEILTIE